MTVSDLQPSGQLLGVTVELDVWPLFRGFGNQLRCQEGGKKGNEVHYCALSLSLHGLIVGLAVSSKLTKIDNQP